MDREEAREYIRKQEPSFLSRARKKGYICPKCGNGTGKDGDGVVRTPDGVHFKCFRCDYTADIIDLYKASENITDDKEAFTRLYNYYGVSVDGNNEQTRPQKKEQVTTMEEQEKDYTEYFKECHENIDKTDYLEKRGLTKAVAERFHLGYDANFPTGGRPWQALIIPTSDTSYVARNADTNADKGNRYRKQGKVHLFNIDALENATQPIFITEGEIDAMCIMAVGGEAIGLGSTSNINLLVQAIRKNRPKQALIIALDNDDAGKEKSKELKKEFKNMSVPHITSNIYGEKKDAGEAIMESKEAFIEAVRDIKDQIADALEAGKQEYIQTNSTASYLDDFLNGIKASVDTPCIPTGFGELDTSLDGGLYEGLYVVGAISSLGKTTLVLQIADNIAKAGNDVLIFSLEMARTELIAKSLSRLTMQETQQKTETRKRYKDLASTVRDITCGSRYQYYTPEKKKLIENAVKAYREYAPHLYIYEGVGDISVDQVKEQVKKHIAFTGKAPVVVVDYMQILAPVDSRATDKTNTDIAVTRLKKISRDYKLPVIAISSFNRKNYNTEVAMDAFKESGAIEYSSDVLIGLQFKGAGATDQKGKSTFNATEAKKKTPRDIQAVILKNRNGRTGDVLNFYYYPAYNYYVSNYSRGME